jgi:hypothetical protein
MHHEVELKIVRPQEVSLELLERPQPHDLIFVFAAVVYVRLEALPVPCCSMRGLEPPGSREGNIIKSRITGQEKRYKVHPNAKKPGPRLCSFRRDWTGNS